MAKKATVISICNQNGGTAKTTTCENLGIGLAGSGKKVLLVDCDPQGSLTIALGKGIWKLMIIGCTVLYEGSRIRTRLD